MKPICLSTSDAYKPTDLLVAEKRLSSKRRFLFQRVSCIGGSLFFAAAAWWNFFYFKDTIQFAYRAGEILSAASVFLAAVEFRYSKGSPFYRSIAVVLMLVGSLFILLVIAGCLLAELLSIAMSNHGIPVD